MKKIIFSVALCSTLFSCGKSADDLDVNDVESACDCVEYANIIAEDILDYVGDKSESEVENDEKFKAKIEKLGKLEDKCRDMKDDMKDCDEFEDLKTTMNKFEEKF